MTKISWNDDLTVGIKSIDNEHKNMISIANEFIRAANQQRQITTLSLLLVKLRENVVSHIKETERIMATVRYDQRARHSLENQRFKVALKHFHRHLKIAGEANTKDLQFFKTTLLKHIKSSNQAIASSVHSLSSPRTSVVN